MQVTVSVVVPAFNEEACLPELFRRLEAVFDAEPDYSWECWIVENGSTDNSWSLIGAQTRRDERFHGIQLSRNFRMDGGLTAGLDFVSGDACVLMTADLQDPPELIHDFLRRWEEGYENVYGVVSDRKGISRLRAFNSRMFYRLAGLLTGDLLPANASDFRLIDRRVYLAIRQMEERNRFVRGLSAWVGFRSIGVPMSRPPRYAGESKAHSLPVVGLAIRGILAHSTVPLRLITVVGFILSLSALLGVVFFSIVWFTRGVPFAGFGTLVSILFLGFGILTLMLGVLSEYLGLIYDEVKRRPNFLVREIANPIKSVPRPVEVSDSQSPLETMKVIDGSHQ